MGQEWGENSTVHILLRIWQEHQNLIWVCPLAQSSPSLESIVCVYILTHEQIYHYKMAMVASFIIANKKKDFKYLYLNNCWSKEELSTLEFVFSLDFCYMIVRRHHHVYWQGKLPNNIVTFKKKLNWRRRVYYERVSLYWSTLRTGASLADEHTFLVIGITPSCL